MESMQVKIERMCISDIEFTISIDKEYTFIDLIKYIQSNYGGEGYSALRCKKTARIVNARWLRRSVLDYCREIGIEKLEFRSLSHFTPKNNFIELYALVLVFDNHLEDTINLDDVCPINHGKIGEWIGFGSGPTTVPLEVSNRLNNVLFFKLDNNKPYAYNIHCLVKMIDQNMVLIPHLNQKIYANKLVNIYNSQNKIKVLECSQQDIVCGV